MTDRPRLVIEFDADDDYDATVDFDLPVRHADGTRGAETLTAYRDPGAATVTFWLGSLRPELVALSAMYRVLADDDGLSDKYTPPIAPTGGIDVDHADYDPRYADPAQWSSLRRFSALTNDPERRIYSRDLTKILDALIGEVTSARPTGRSAPSSRGPKRTKAGSTGRRSTRG